MGAPDGDNEFRLGTTADGEPLALEPRDLTTHGVIVGMTGSGKTGLGLVLLEEALSAGVPVLALDPKGDLGNLLLTFPDSAPASFQPWVDEAAARDAGLSVEQYAARVAAEWKEGLAASGIGPERIQALRDAAELTIYTPGSSAGIPLNLIGSLQAPALSWETEAETLRDEIEGTVTSLLGLVGLQAEPLSSREHVLLSNLVEHAWRGGRDLDLGGLIGEIQSPPLRKLGVFELDAFFPPQERTALALKLNALVASPSFAIWGEGAALDPAELLGEPGKPRAAIVYLAHLSEEERQFAVTLILSKVVTWMRGLSGTSDLRALVYMDEVYGFVPPTAVPPAKKPILTILKQARAYGVGMVLATQNPVDLDYKAMSNAATWLVGRLQTERDKERVLEGLRSAAGGTDLAALDEAVGGLQKRQFLLVSAHEPKPVVFSTRWAMSYLRGPLTKAQIEILMQGRERPAAAAPAAVPAPAAAPSAPSDGLYVHPAAPWLAQVGGSPARHAAAPIPGGAPEPALRRRERRPRHDPGMGSALRAARGRARSRHRGRGRLRRARPRSDAAVGRDVRRSAGRDPGGVVPAQGGDRDPARATDAQALTIFRNRELKLYSRPGETSEAFAARADAEAQTQADREAAKIRDRLEAKRDRLEAALETARRRADELATDEKTRTTTELLAGAGTILNVLLGGRGSARTIARAGGAIGSAASRRGMTARTGERRRTAEEKAEATEQTLAELEQEIVDEVAEIDAEWTAKADEIEELEIRLESSDVRVVELKLVWVPTA